MAKADNIIAEIGEMLKIGKERADILANIVDKWQISARTFDRHLKIANERYKETQQAIIKAVNDTLQAETVEAIKTGLKTDLELEAILSGYATGSILTEDIIDGTAVLRGLTPLESMKAIDLLFKKRGSNAPIKTKATIETIVPILSFDPLADANDNSTT